MGLADRIELYRQIEKLRGHPLISYVTSSRMNAQGVMAPDTFPEISDQILLLPSDCDKVDLLLVSHGGDPAVAWRIMSLLRDQVSEVSVLIPQAAYSAATLLALGADEIIMHACGNLGPVDPQITVQRPRPGGQGNELIHFGSEDLAGFLNFIKETVGLSDQEHVKSAFQLFCQEAGAIPIAISTRAAQLSVSMGEKLLRMHMKDDTGGQKARAIAETLNKKFFHHGYPVGRKEAKEIGLKVVEPEPALEGLMWTTWRSLELEMKCREPFNYMSEIERNPALADQLFAAIPQAIIPHGLPPALMQQAVQAILQQISTIQLPGIDYEKIQALMESPRAASAYVTRGKLFARREHDLKISINDIVLFSGWRETQLPPIAITSNEPTASSTGRD